MHGLNFRERKSFSVLITGFTRASLRPTPRTAAVNETATEAEEEDEVEHDLSASLVDDMFDLTEQEKHSLHNAGMKNLIDMCVVLTSIDLKAESVFDNSVSDNFSRF